ncbi:MAG: CPBP family intramembrane metalloprotease [Verrucomicrobia bacterium]|nr:CPBP family intramembrane metalloprotease [Prolixibacteraceae bacterium]
MIQSIKATFKNWVTFLKSPQEETSTDLSFAHKMKITGNLFLIELPVTLLFIVLIGLLIQFKLIDLGKHGLEDLMAKLSYLQLILILVLIVPFMEEILFRLPLKYKRNYLLRGLVWIVSQTGIIQKEKLNEKVQRYWKSAFRYFFYMMAFSFGFIHLTNFEKAGDLILLLPLLTLSQCVGGLIIGYLRVKLGFLWGYFYHSFFNFIFFTISFLSFQSALSSLETTLPYHFKDDTASIDILESKPDARNNGKAFSDCSITPGRIEYHQFKVDDLVASLYMKTHKYVITNGIQFIKDKDIIDIKSELYANQSNTDSIRYLLTVHLQKALGLKIEKRIIQKDAWEVYVIDKAKIHKDTSNKELMQVNGSLMSIARYLDRIHSKEFIFSSDEINQSSIIMPINANFEMLHEYLEKEYGIGLRKVKKDIEFITIERTAIQEEKPMI